MLRMRRSHEKQKVFNKNATIVTKKLFGIAEPSGANNLTTGET